MPNVLVALLVLVPAFATGLGLTWLSGLRLGPEERLAVAAVDPVVVTAQVVLVLVADHEQLFQRFPPVAM